LSPALTEQLSRMAKRAFPFGSPAGAASDGRAVFGERRQIVSDAPLTGALRRRQGTH